MTAINVLAVDGIVKSPDVVKIRSDMQNGKAGTKWKTLLFGDLDDPANKVNDLLTKLTGLNATAIGMIEIVSEGAPFALDGVDMHTSASRGTTFGNRLRQEVPGISATSNIYLSGCNTGLGLNALAGALDKDIAQIVANSSQAIVLGAVGFISGAHAFRSEKTVVASGNGKPYAGATMAVGDNCWRTCRPTHGAQPVRLADLSTGAPILAPGLVTRSQLDRFLEDVHTEALSAAPTFRVSAEWIISSRDSGLRDDYEIVANSGFLRNATTYELWPNSQGYGLVALAEARLAEAAGRAR